MLRKSSYKISRKGGASIKRNVTLGEIINENNNQNNMEHSQKIQKKEDQFSPLKDILFKLKLKQQVQNVANQTSNRRQQKLQYQQHKFFTDKTLNVVNFKEKKIDQLMHYKHKNFFQQILYIFYEKIPTFDPQSYFKLFWDILMSSIITCLLFYIPIHLIYHIQFSVLITKEINFLLPLVFFVDLIFNLNTGYYQKGNLVIKRSKIIVYFIKNHWFTDIFSILPFFFVQQIENLSIHFRCLLFFLFFQKLQNIQRLFNRIESLFSLNKKAVNIISLCQLMAFVLFVSHIFASIWLFVGLNTHNLDKKSWIQVRNIINSEWQIQYLNSYYFATVTMITVGFGDINPQNNIEIIICSIAMLTACGVFAYAVNSVGAIFQEFFAFEKELKYNMNVINNFMANKKISRKLQEQIQQYLDYYWRQQLSKNADLEQKIINQLSDNLKEQLLMEANRQILINAPIFKTNFSESLIPRIIPLIKEQHYTPNEKIFESDDINDNQIYFIEKGKVQICINYRNPFQRKQKSLIKIYQLQCGDHFGTLGFFTGQGRNFTVKTESFCSLLSIKRADFIQLLQEFPEDYEKFCYIRDLILFPNDYQKIGLKCFCCLKGNHLIDTCPIIHYIPHKFKIIWNQSVGVPNYERLTFDRKRKKKNSTFAKIKDNQDDALNYLDDHEEQIDNYVEENIMYDSDKEEYFDSFVSSSNSSNSNQSIKNKLIQNVAEQNNINRNSNDTLGFLQLEKENHLDKKSTNSFKTLSQISNNRKQQSSLTLSPLMDTNQNDNNNNNLQLIKEQSSKNSIKSSSSEDEISSQKSLTQILPQKEEYSFQNIDIPQLKLRDSQSSIDISHASMQQLKPDYLQNKQSKLKINNRKSNQEDRQRLSQLQQIIDLLNTINKKSDRQGLRCQTKVAKTMFSYNGQKDNQTVLQRDNSMMQMAEENKGKELITDTMKVFQIYYPQDNYQNIIQIFILDQQLKKQQEVNQLLAQVNQSSCLKQRVISNKSEVNKKMIQSKGGNRTRKSEQQKVLNMIIQAQSFKQQQGEEDKSSENSYTFTQTNMEMSQFSNKKMNKRVTLDTQDFMIDEEKLSEQNNILINQCDDYFMGYKEKYFQ